jgi:hypothetical protein
MCLLCLFIHGAYSFIIFDKLLLKTKYLEWVLNEELHTVKCNKKQVIYILTHPVVCNYSHACYKIKVCTTSFRYTIRGAHLGHVVVHFWWRITSKNK